VVPGQRAQATITPARLGSPAAAKTPAVMTRLSLGTTGKKASMAAKAKRAANTHGEPMAPSTSWVMASAMGIASLQR